MAPYGVPALSNRKALDVFDSFLQDDRIGLIVMSPRGWKLPGVSSRASAQLWMDAYLAAFALSGGYQLITTDGGFRQFSGLDLLVLN